MPCPPFFSFPGAQFEICLCVLSEIKSFTSANFHTLSSLKELFSSDFMVLAVLKQSARYSTTQRPVWAQLLHGHVQWVEKNTFTKPKSGVWKVQPVAQGSFCFWRRQPGSLCPPLCSTQHKSCVMVVIALGGWTQLCWIGATGNILDQHQPHNFLLFCYSSVQMELNITITTISQVDCTNKFIVKRRKKKNRKAFFSRLKCCCILSWILLILVIQIFKNSCINLA